MELLSKILKTSSLILADAGYWVNKIQKECGITPETTLENLNNDPIIYRQIYSILRKMPPELVGACGIKRLLVRDDMGPNREFFPNHGYFVGDRVALNSDIFYHPDTPGDFMDHHGYFVSRPEQTIFHEFGHGYDEYNDNLSLKDDWLGLSGWSPTPKPGLKRIVINDPGSPKVVGEWFYDPNAGFTRFYAKRNSWDDFADCFSFYIANLKTKLPINKREYFDRLLNHYYS